jgi:DNA-binding winged helix-turn-helix (wHTH) protein
VTITFGTFSLDEDTGQLWHVDAARPLRAKSFAVLCELARRRGRVVTKEELFRSCWPATAVSQTVLRVCIREIRVALAEEAPASVALETVGRRGYRLVTAGETVELPSDPLVGRDREMSVLRHALGRADAGIRQVVFVGGERGIGKTTLLEHFVEETRARTGVRVTFGQCAELTGGTEPYLPIFDLLGGLCAEEAGDVLASLERWAPSWLLQMPALLDGERAARLRQRVPSPNRDRMLRELGEALEALGAARTLVVVLEDLHWSDASSIGALSYLAQRTKPARLLIVGSHRPVDHSPGEDPLQGARQTLVARGRASELRLDALTSRDVDAYLARRLRGQSIDPALGGAIHARTGGNPLFVTATVDYLLERGLLGASGGRWRTAEPLDGVVPDGLRQLALQRIQQLAPEERRVLDAASVVGPEFSVAAVAAATAVAPAAVEHVCVTLAARTELVSVTGVEAWPDGTVSGRYEFRHVLYREVLEDALSPMSRRRLHRTVGERLQQAWEGRSAEIAAALAIHADAAGDVEGAVRHHLTAAASAKARFASGEAILHSRAALERLRRLPETEARAQTELACLLDLCGSLVSTRGAAPADVFDVHGRALELADRLDLPRARIQVQSARHVFDVARADLRHARDVAEDLLITAERVSDPFCTVIAHGALGTTLFNVGELRGAARHLEHANAVWQPTFRALALDPSVMCRAMLGLTELHVGRPEVGAGWIRNALAHAESMHSAYNLSSARELAAVYWATAGERELALDQARATEALASEHEFVIHAAVATIIRGWAERDLAVLRDGIARYEGAGQYVASSFFRALLVEGLLEQDRVQEARDELGIVEAFVERSGERRHVPELHRLEGECLRRHDDDAGACFETAMSVAREQGARLFELRAATSLASLRAARGERDAVRRIIDAAMDGFDEGCDLPDLRRARALRAAS